MIILEILKWAVQSLWNFFALLIYLVVILAAVEMCCSAIIRSRS